MNTLVILSALLLMGFAAASPLDEKIFTITDSFYIDDFVVYTGENDITKIVVPLNSINFDENTDIESIDIYVFFIEKTKGLYVLKSGDATKLLDNGKDVASSMDDSTTVYIGATDGIYTFNAKTNTAEKYGTLSDNIKNIIVTNSTEEIYILTEDRVFYKVVDDGTKKEEITNVKDAEQIALDTYNNLFFVDSKRHVYVRSSEDGTVRKIKGLPANPKYAELVRPPAVADGGVAFISGKKVYGVLPNGTSEFTGLVLNSAPTAVSVEASLVLYFAHDKKIYQCSIMDIIGSSLDAMAPVKSYIDNKTTDIKRVAKKKTLRQ